MTIKLFNKRIKLCPKMSTRVKNKPWYILLVVGKISQTLVAVSMFK